jgi:hypothetical protein
MEDTEIGHDRGDVDADGTVRAAHAATPRGGARADRARRVGCVGQAAAGRRTVRGGSRSRHPGRWSLVSSSDASAGHRPAPAALTRRNRETGALGMVGLRSWSLDSLDGFVSDLRRVESRSGQVLFRVRHAARRPIAPRGSTPPLRHPSAASPACPVSSRARGARRDRGPSGGGARRRRARAAPAAGGPCSPPRATSRPSPPAPAARSAG